jgi:hypothetical protein
MNNFTKTIARIIGSVVIAYFFAGLVIVPLWFLGFEERIVTWATKGGLLATMIPFHVALFIALGRIKSLTIQGPNRSN